ncbi:MAG: phosphatidylglycerol lysyltransferase domain-containing protein [Methanocorpusculum sp.]|nr:phosphatidylglycerol lysyltransferase domain-containing protein [Methanocorpusculum sp.]
MLSIEDFTPVTYQNKSIIEDYFHHYPQCHSECSIVTILAWEHYSPSFFAEKNGRLLLCCLDEGAYAFQAPIGEPDPELLTDILRLARDTPGENSVNIYSEENLLLMRKHHPLIPVHELRGYFEYYYKTDDLAHLKGKKYLNIRGQINTFKARYKYTVEKITRENMPEVRAMVEQWSESKHCEANAVMREEITAVNASFDHWTELPLEGIAVRITEDNKLAAMAVWEMMSDDTAVIHYEKALGEYPGLYKIVNMETARELLGKCEWINRESDMNVEGLREAKLRYHPDTFAKAYYIEKEDIRTACL